MNHSFKENLKGAPLVREDDYNEMNMEFLRNEEEKFKQVELLEQMEKAEKEFMNRGTNNDQIMRAALERLKAEQAGTLKQEKQQQENQSWEEYKTGNIVALQKEETAEKRSFPESTNTFTKTPHFTTEPTVETFTDKNRQINKELNKNENFPHQGQLIQIREALENAVKENDAEQISLLEEQEKNLLNINPEPSKEDFSNNNDQKEHFKVSKPLSLHDKEKELETPSFGIDNDIQNSEPGEETLSKLHELGIDYKDLVQMVPNFSKMSEGQQAYILFKAQEQGFEHIQEKADSDFERRKNNAGLFKKIFSMGSMRREANRNAAAEHKGINVFAEDIKSITKHVDDNAWDIKIQKDGTYQIEYVKTPEDISEKDSKFFSDYNRSATALSDVPYEWSLPTANKNERKAYEQALKAFEVQENNLRKILQESGKDHPDILKDTFTIRSQVELNQFFSSYPDLSVKLDDMKNATFKSDLTKKILNPSLIGTGLGAGTRVATKALWGLGGAAGASVIIAGIMAWRRKNSEFQDDSKSARRGGELKKTTDKVFNARANAERITKLLKKIEGESNPLRRERSLNALTDRLQILDERLKKGRVNFGKAKEQLSNKALLMEVLTQAHLYQYQLENIQPTDLRVSDYFNKQDKNSKKERNKERISAVTIGGLIGAGSATVSWMVADYFRGEDVSDKILEVVNTDPDVALPEKQNQSFPGIGAGKEAYNAISSANVEISVDASSKGAIATFENLQQELRAKYPNVSLAPAHIQEFLGKTPTELAIEENFYRPGDVNESAKIYKGGKLGFNEKGELFYSDVRNGTDILSGNGKFNGGHFDFNNPSFQDSGVKNISEVKVSPVEIESSKAETLHPGTEWETSKKTWMDLSGENQRSSITNTTSDVSETLLSEKPQIKDGLHTVKLSEKFNVDFDVIEDSKGRPQTRFHNVNLDNFNAYHRAYLKNDLASYAQALSVNTEFMVGNVGMTREAIEHDLQNLVNQMIMRDQVLQEGGLSSSSEEYQILKRERDTIRKVIKDNFEWYGNDIVGSLDGNKYPDPKYPIESNTISKNISLDQDTVFKSNQNQVQNPTSNFFEQNIQTDPQKTEILGTNTEAVKNIKFSVTRDESGLISDLKAIEGSIDPSKVSLNEFGFNKDWQTLPEFSAGFKDTPSGKKLISDISTVKTYLALRDTLPKTSEEYIYLDKMLKNRMYLIKSKYPSIFE